MLKKACRGRYCTQNGMTACNSVSLRGRNTSVLDVEGDLPHGLQPPEQAPSEKKCVTLTGAHRQLRFPKELADLGHAPLTNPSSAHSRIESDLYADTDEEPPSLRVSELNRRPRAEASYLESLCDMSHELHMHRCHSESSQDIFTIIRTPSKAFAALMTPPLSPLSVASTRPASPGDLYFSDDFCPSSHGGLMGKIIDIAFNLGRAVRTFLSLLLWCCALLLGLLLVDLMVTAELLQDCE